MNRVLALFSIIVLMGFATWAIMSTDGTPEPETDTPTVAAEEPQLEEVPELDAPADTEDDLAEASVERTDYQPSGLVKDSSVTYAEGVDEGILISVVEAESGDAIPHAEVMVIDTGVVDESAIEMEMMRQPDFEGIFLHFGVIYQANAKGQVKIPFPEKDLVLAGRTATHFDFMFDVDTSAEELELKIKKVDILKVEVVDAASRPVAGAPVGLRMREHMFAQDMMRNFTDSNGTANLRLFNMLTMQLPPDKTFVALLGLFEEPIEEPVNLRELPDEPIKLVMPEVGSITVNIFDSAGDPMEEFLAVMLDPIVPGQEINENLPERFAGLSNTTSTGKIVFPAVGFGLTVRVRAMSRGGIMSAEQTIEGPTSGNKEVDMQLTMEIKDAVVVGRLVNEEGKPGPNLTLRKNLDTTGQHGSSSVGGSVRTDEDGYFRVKLDEPGVLEGDTRTLTLTFKATRKKPQRDVAIDLTRTFDPGENDIGDVMITAPPLAASGVVLAPDGKPQRGVEVRLERREQWGEGPEDFYWDNLWDSSTQSERDGSFSIAGRFEPGIYRLRADHENFPATFMDINLGVEGLQIIMNAGGRVKGVLLLDDGVPHDSLQVRLIPDPDANLDQNDMGEIDLQVNGDGTFYGRGLKPGLMSLVVRTFTTNEEFARIANIQVAVGDDGEFDVGDIDLRGQLIWFTMSFERSDGKSLDRVRLHSVAEEYETSTWESSVTIITAQPSKDFVVSAQEFRSVELTGINKDTVVTFQEGYQVRVRISNPGVIPAGYGVRLSMLPEEDSTLTRISYVTSGEMLDGNFEQILLAPTTGTYFVQCNIGKLDPNDNNGWWNVRSKAEAQRVEIIDVPNEQIFSVELDESNVEEILKMMNR